MLLDSIQVSCLFVNNLKLESITSNYATQTVSSWKDLVIMYTHVTA